jgi:hypothetical protein
MVAYPLVDAKIDAGRRLLEKLDEVSFPVTAAFWLYLTESSDWRLFVASPLTSSIGKRDAYSKLQQTLLELQADPTFVLQPLGLREITLVRPDDEMVNTLALAVSTGPGISGIRLSRNSINGVYIEDAYIYRTGNQ